MKPKQSSVTMSVGIVAVWLLSCSAAAGSPTVNGGSVGLVDSHAFADVRSEGTATTALSSESTDLGWYMAGANPERTSWVPEEVRGNLDPDWFIPIEPYIPPNVQVIATDGMLYLSTARGLYAFDAGTGAQVWVYPTELPLGHSPTVVNGVAYVGGFDHKLHAIDAYTGESLWRFEAQKGFRTNPLVVNGMVYAGNRDGSMYAVDATTGGLVWRYQTDGPILYSAAYGENTIYFASDDSHAYALNATDGTLLWKSAKLPGAGFHSYWPVVYRENVILAGSNNYRFGAGLGPGPLVYSVERDDIYPNYQDFPEGTTVGPLGYEPGDWAQGTVTIDTSQPTGTENGSTTPITEYFEQPTAEEIAADPAGLDRHNHKPWRRTYFVLDRQTGQEYTTDFDGDGQVEYAPILYFNTHGAGNRYPPLVAGDGVLYQSNNYQPDGYPWGHVTGWKINTPFISLPLFDVEHPTWNRNAVDEPQGYAGGGNLIYWNRCCNRVAAAFDITQLGTKYSYYNYNLDSRVPGYDVAYEGSDDTAGSGYFAFGGINGIYGDHVGDQNPPIPYQGRVYMHRGNSLIAFAPRGVTLTELPPATTVPVQDDSTPLARGQLKSLLEAEMGKMIDTGHLRPGYYSTGAFDHNARVCGNTWVDYYHNPADTINTLLRALPHLSTELQQQTRAYLQNEFSSYPPHQYWHIGWQDGEPREVFGLPPESEAARADFPARQGEYYGSFQDVWTFPPHQFYALWKYAQVFGEAQALFEAATSTTYLMDNLDAIPEQAILEEMPYVHNAYIAGYLGYIELGKLAGLDENDPDLQAKQAQLDQLLVSRAQLFSKDTKWDLGVSGDVGKMRCRNLNLARNFIHMVPELADYLHDHALDKVQETVDQYQRIAPYWFVSKFPSSYNEATLDIAYNYHALFQAKAQILEEPYEELAKYLDVPAFPRGDLFYIDNLISAIEAPHDLEKSAAPHFGDQGDPITYTLSFTAEGSVALTDTLPIGISAPVSFELGGTDITPTYDSDQHRLTWSDSPPVAQEVTIRYSVTITTAQPQLLTNTAQLGEVGGEASTATATVVVNFDQTFLPIIHKHR